MPTRYIVFQNTRAIQRVLPGLNHFRRGVRIGHITPPFFVCSSMRVRFCQLLDALLTRPALRTRPLDAGSSFALGVGYGVGGILIMRPCRAGDRSRRRYKRRGGVLRRSGPLCLIQGRDSMAKGTKGRSRVASTSLPKKLRPASRRLLKELPTEAEIAKRLISLRRYGHQATAIMGASYLENALEFLLRKIFRDLHREDDDRLFDGAQGGILGSFSAKIRLTYAVKRIHENPYKALLLINDIRNVFAHSLHRVSFNSDEVKKDCQSLYAISSELSSAASLHDGDAAIDIYAGIIRTLYYAIKREADSVSRVHVDNPS